MATHSNILAWRIPGQRSLAGYSPWGHTESDTAQTAPVSWGSLYHAGHIDKISLTAKEVQIIDSYIFSKHCSVDTKQHIINHRTAHPILILAKGQHHPSRSPWR